MDHVTIADGCSIQGSVICSNVQLQERAVLRDCQVIIHNHIHTLSPSGHYRPISSLVTSLTLLQFSFQVGAGFVVTAACEYKGEALARKEK